MDKKIIMGKAIDAIKGVKDCVVWKNMICVDFYNGGSAVVIQTAHGWTVLNAHRPEEIGAGVTNVSAEDVIAWMHVIAETAPAA